MNEKEKKNLERLPPHSIEAEQGVLGCVMLDPQVGLGFCLECFGARAEDVFYEPRHQMLYDVMCAMFEERRLIDLITLQDRLSGMANSQSPIAEKREGLTQLEMVGGLPYLMSLQDAAPSAANLEYYAAMVKSKWTLRRMLRVVVASARRIYEPLDGDAQLEAETICAQIEAEVLSVNQGSAKQNVEHVKAPLMRVLERLENYQRGVGLISGLRTGFSYFDKMTGGVQLGELALIAARPSVGKTTLMMNFVEYISMDSPDKEPVLVISMEMKSDDLVLRTLCSMSGADMSQIRTGFMSDRDAVRITSVAPKLAGAPIYFFSGSGLDIMEIRAVGRRYARQFGVKMIVIDYAQLAQSEKVRRNRGTREQEVAAISGGCKAMAMELNVAVVLLSQLNREMEKHGKRPPQLSDLKESGALEQDADLAAMLWRPNMEKEEALKAEESGVWPTVLTVAKNRNGRTGDCELGFLKARNKFVDGCGGTGKREGVEKVKKMAKREMPTEQEFGNYGK